MIVLTRAQRVRLAVPFLTVGALFIAGVLIKQQHPQTATVLEVAAVLLGLGTQALRMPFANRLLLSGVTLVAALAAWVAAIA